VSVPVSDPIVEKLNELVEETDHEFTASLVEQFLSEAPLMLEDIGRAVAAGDYSQAARLAHSLAPNCGSFGLVTLWTALKQFETQCKKGQIELARAAWPAIQAGFSAGEQELQRISRQVLHAR
jgi:HPt (histidine-containing phosphotransfer) domain-containing protein